MRASSKIVFFGNERLSTGFIPQGAPTLEALIANNYQVALVVANYERGTSRNARQLEIQDVAQKHNIPVLLPANLKEAAERIKQTGASMGVLVAYGKIIPQSIIDLFPLGIINIHPSLLPLYRGPTPIEQAILDGAPKTGVSVMQLSKAMDAGPIFAQAKLPLSGQESKQHLTELLLTRGSELLIAKLPHIIDGSLSPKAQDESRATYTHLLTKDDARLDISKPATLLERQIRAFAGWPKSRVSLFGHEVTIQKARVAATPVATEGLILPCGHSTYLEVLELTAPSGRTITGADFLRGYKK